MFNFTAMNQALSDVNVSDKEFRMLYLFANNSSLNENDEIEMYNGFLMDKLNLSERQVQRLTKSLVEKNYLTKVVKGTSKNRNGNTYRLNYNITEIRGDKNVTHDIDSDITCDTSCDKNVTPYNRTKENKNISMYKGKDSGNETIHVPGNGKSEVCTVSVAGTITDDVHSDEVRETSQREKLTKAEIEERNNYITSTFNRLETKLNYLYSISDSRIFGDVSMSIADIFNDATEKRRWFTDKQWGKLLRYGDRYEKIVDGKQAYFNGTGKKDADAELTSTDEKPFTEKPEKNTTDNDTDNGGGVAPQQYKRMTKEELEAWVSEDVKKYPDFTSWQNALEAKLDRKFKGWQEGKHLYISCMYNFVTGMAAKHFNRLEIEKRAEKYSQPVSKPYNEINEGTGILAENGTEPHSRFLRAFLPLGGIVGHPE